MSNDIHGLFAGKIWQFSGNDRILSSALELRNDGTLRGYTHPNESNWAGTESEITFFNTHGIETGKLIRVRSSSETIEYAGVSLIDPKTTFVLRETSWDERPHYSKETRRLLAEDINRYGWEIGAHTYGRPSIHERIAKLRIGKFCSIAGGVEIALGNHRTDTVSSYPFIALNAFWPSANEGTDHVSRGDVTIGNDVWIAASSFIGSGVTIGDGAVIGAHAVVSRDVPPYAIVGGNPSKIIRYRFTEVVIAQLLDIAWWNWSDEKINRFLPAMYTQDIATFIEQVTSADIRS